MGDFLRAVKVSGSAAVRLPGGPSVAAAAAAAVGDRAGGGVAVFPSAVRVGGGGGRHERPNLRNVEVEVVALVLFKVVSLFVCLFVVY